MINHGPKPIVKSCGCWLWCEVCNGTGEVIDKKSSAIWTPVMMKCPECSGKPQKLKYCRSHVAGLDNTKRGY